MSLNTTEPLADCEALINAIGAAEKPVAFLLGSPLSMMDDKGVPGVPGTKEMLKLALEQAGPHLRSKLEVAISTGTDAQRYQRAMAFLRDNINQQAVNAVVRKAVLQARISPLPEPVPSDAHIERDIGGWHLPAATRDLGILVESTPAKFGPILTTNFDPLIKVAIHCAKGRVAQSILHADGSLGDFKPETGDHWLIHLHGYWTGSDTLHTPIQLTSDRPHLLASLQKLLREHVLAVVGYGGWDDVFTRALTQLGHDAHADIDVLWAFYESDADLVNIRYQNLFSGIGSALARGRFRRYGGVDCHKLFRALRESRGSASAGLHKRTAPTAHALPPTSSVVSTRETAPALVRRDSPPPSPPAHLETVSPAPPPPPVVVFPVPASSEPAKSPNRTATALPLVGFVGVLLAVGFVVANTGTSTTKPPSGVIIPIGTPLPPSPSNGEPDRAPRSAHAPREANSGTLSVPDTRRAWDSVASPQPVDPSTGKRATNIEDLRRQNRVRSLARSDNGIRVGQMPQGSFGFVPLDHAPMLMSASIIETSLPHTFEVHRTHDGSLFLNGYAHDATAKAISSGRPVEAILVTNPSGSRTRLVSLPFSRVRAGEVRSDAGNKVLLLELASVNQ